MTVHVADQHKRRRLTRAPALARFNSMPSASGEMSRLACTLLRKGGAQLEPLLSKAGLSVELINTPGARLKVQSQINFLNLAAEELRDDFLGFHLAQSYDLRELGLLYYVLASSEKLAEALEKAERYSGIVNDGVSLRVRHAREMVVELNYVNVERKSDRHQIEFFLMSLVRLCRQLTNRQLMPARIRVMHRRSKGLPAELKKFLGCEIEFGCGVDELVFQGSARSLPVTSADPYLEKLLVKYCEEAIAHRSTNRGALRPSVENAIIPLLPHGKALANEVARHLGMSQRTLARRLSAEQLSFSQVLDELRVRSVQALFARRGLADFEGRLAARLL